MVGSISRKLLTELGIRTEDAECKLKRDKCNFVIFVLIIKSCVGHLCCIYVYEKNDKLKKILTYDQTKTENEIIFSRQKVKVMIPQTACQKVLKQ